MGIWNILVLVPISIQGKGPEQHTHVKVLYIDRPWGSLPHFFPFTSLVDHTFPISTIMSLVDITLRLPPPSQCRCSTQFTIPTALRNGYEKMGIPGSGVFTPAIPTALDLNHARELTNPHLVVRKPLGGGEFVWKEFLSRYAIGLGVSEYLPFTTSAPLGEVSQDAPSCATVWRLEELKGKFPLKPVKIVQGSCICLQDTSLVDDPSFPQLPTVWGMACGIAWAEPELEIHYLFVHISSTSIPPTPIYSERILVVIPNKYLDSTRTIPRLQQPSLGQRQIGSTDHYLCPLSAWEERKKKRRVQKDRRGVRKESRERCTRK